MDEAGMGQRMGFVESSVAVDRAGSRLDAGREGDTADGLEGALRVASLRKTATILVKFELAKARRATAWHERRARSSASSRC